MDNEICNKKGKMHVLLKTHPYVIQMWFVFLLLQTVSGQITAQLRTNWRIPIQAELL
jgi:hypothetical protein